MNIMSSFIEEVDTLEAGNSSADGEVVAWRIVATSLQPDAVELDRWSRQRCPAHTSPRYQVWCLLSAYELRCKAAAVRRQVIPAFKSSVTSARWSAIRPHQLSSVRRCRRHEGTSSGLRLEVKAQFVPQGVGKVVMRARGWPAARVVFGRVVAGQRRCWD